MRSARTDGWFIYEISLARQYVAARPLVLAATVAVSATTAAATVAAAATAAAAADASAAVPAVAAAATTGRTPLRTTEIPQVMMFIKFKWYDVAARNCQTDAYRGASMSSAPVEAAMATALTVTAAAAAAASGGGSGISGRGGNAAN